MTEFHPVQTQHAARNDSQIPDAITRRAYEVYAHVYSPQPAMIDLAGRGCRGGFGVGELFAFLYARSFPKEEWKMRVEDAFKRPEKHQAR